MNLDYRIVRDGKDYTLHECALQLYKDGHHIMPYDVECLAISLDNAAYHIIDECGNAVYLNPKVWEVVVDLRPILGRSDGAEQPAP